jgi:hypothetical protein
MVVTALEEDRSRKEVALDRPYVARRRNEGSRRRFLMRLLVPDLYPWMQPYRRERAVNNLILGVGKRPHYYGWGAKTIEFSAVNIG